MGCLVRAAILLSFAAPVAAVLLVGRYIWVEGGDVEPSIALPTYVAAGTFLLAVWSAAYLIYTGRSTATATEHDRHQIAVYEGAFSMLFVFFGRPAADESEPDGAGSAEQLHTFTERLILRGSDDVVRYWSLLQDQSSKETGRAGGPSLETVLMWEHFLRLLREDVGQSQQGLESGDLLRVFANALGSEEARQALDTPHVRRREEQLRRSEAFRHQFLPRVERPNDRTTGSGDATAGTPRTGRGREVIERVVDSLHYKVEADEELSRLFP